MLAVVTYLIIWSEFWSFRINRSLILDNSEFGVPDHCSHMKSWKTLILAVFHVFGVDYRENEILLGEMVIIFESAVKFYIGVYTGFLRDNSKNAPQRRFSFGKWAKTPEQKFSVPEKSRKLIRWYRKFIQNVHMGDV